jgi:hypothetical protein
MSRQTTFIALQDRDQSEVAVGQDDAYRRKVNTAGDIGNSAS